MKKRFKAKIISVLLILCAVMFPFSGITAGETVLGGNDSHNVYGSRGGSNPLNITDCGGDCYYVYDPGMWNYGESESVARMWSAALAGEYKASVHIIAVESWEEFQGAWNSIDDSEGAKAVAISFHSTPEGFEILESGEYIDLEQIAALEDKKIDLLMWLQCNGGHLDYRENIASELNELSGIQKVLAADGTTWNWFYKAKIQSLGDAGWASLRDSAGGNPNFTKDNYFYTVNNGKLVCESDDKHGSVRQNAGWIMYQGDYIVQIHGNDVIGIDSLIKKSHSYSVYDYDLSDTEQYQKAMADFQRTMAWKLITNRFTEVSEDWIVKTRMRYSDLYDVVNALLFIEQSQSGNNGG